MALANMLVPRPRDKIRPRFDKATAIAIYNIIAMLTADSSCKTPSLRGGFTGDGCDHG